MIWWDFRRLPQEVAAFVADPSTGHLEQIVDRLLASAQFGERWGRHWFDIARYGESAGSSRDVLMLYAWRYRDFVIDAFNSDMPFDRFVTEQIAGDLLPAETARGQVSTNRRDRPARDRFQVAQRRQPDLRRD